MDWRLLVILALAACDPTPRPSSGAGLDAGASPNASILPSPLASEAPDLYDAGASHEGGHESSSEESASRTGPGDAAPPEPLRPDSPLAPEPLAARDLSGIALEAAWRWRDLPQPSKAPEVSADGIKEAQKRTSLTWKVELTDSGRMRVEFSSQALPMPERSEIRARADRYGNIVLWPNGTRYRVVAPGALRTVLGERRVDVTPLTSRAGSFEGEGRRLGITTRKMGVDSTLGRLKLELGKVGDAGEGGPLLCRALVEIVGVDPKTPLCAAGEVPLLATYSWQGGGGITFEVTSLSKRTDLSPGDFAVPPPGAAYADAGLPETPSGIFLTLQELAAFRTAPLALPPPTEPGIPGEGYVAANQTDVMMYLLLDGVPTVAVPAGQEQYVIGPQRGRYQAQWRTFLGDRVEPVQTVEMPARIVTAARAPAPGR